ncbi:LysR substrate-binding domain-containing protein [Pseudogulbenkiania sp. MAI-1]|uniref:LysR substrate-binding domain-containing protein n=1 Tax=Pseudogulbenkiania sp. MAI-1 TaxID=990370 RepID=UPI00045E7BC8|nr:LysR substrate-binding domain-containing protein [Pseudogulbenkiania sp. MAI-1]
MTLRQLPLYGLQVFEVAARHMSFTLAADELCLTQGAVSKQVAQLEQQLGYPLFHRQVRRLVLTSEGEALLPYVTRALATLGKGVEAARQARNHLRLKAPSCISRWLLREIMQFRKEHPEIEVEVTSVHAHDVDFAKEPFDLAIVFGPVPARQPRQTALFREQLTPVCTPALLESFGHPLNEPEDLVRFPLLHASRDRRDWTLWLKSVGAKGANPASGQLFDTLDLAMNAAQQGFGVSMADVVLLEEELKRGTVITPFAQTLFTGNGYLLALPAPNRTAEAAQLLHDWLAARHPLPDEPQPGPVPGETPAQAMS